MPETRIGGCHCGAVRYEVEVDLAGAIQCNCSICTKNGFIWAFAPMETFKLLAGEGALAEYQFHNHVVRHLFCTTCGVQSFARGRMPDGAETAAINLRCLDGIDLAALAPTPVDGRSL